MMLIPMDLCRIPFDLYLWSIPPVRYFFVGRVIFIGSHASFHLFDSDFIPVVQAAVIWLDRCYPSPWRGYPTCDAV